MNLLFFFYSFFNFVSSVSFLSVFLSRQFVTLFTGPIADVIKTYPNVRIFSHYFNYTTNTYKVSQASNETGAIFFNL